MSVQLAWNLDRTSTSTIKGLLHAATTDNVQPLAIIACEQFGNTLAVSLDTIRKIEHCVVPTPQPAVLAFLQSTIGYSTNDCISYLGKSLAGLQFLGLAAALIIGTDIYKAAEALQAMLVSAANDKTLVPTILQVRDLLASIEPRCHRSGFADDVAGWHLLLARHSISTYFPGSSAHENGIYAPGKEGLKNLVDALRQLNRVGASDITRVTVRTASCAAWTIAFVKWSLGSPPSVVSCSASVSLLEDPESKVTVIISSDRQDDQDFSVTLFSSIHSPSNLVVKNWHESIVGMVSLQTYGELLLQRCGFGSGLAGKAFREAVSYSLHKAMKQLSRSLMFADRNQPHETTYSVVKGSNQKENLATSFKSLADALKLSPFRENAISKLYQLLFSEETDLFPSQDEIDISELPHVALFTKGCQCYSCQPHNDHVDRVRCDFVRFYINLSGIVGDILALSLVDCPELLRVSSNAMLEYEHESKFQIGVTRIIRDRTNTGIGISDLLDRTLHILGHDVKNMKEYGWVISSAKGQALWPTIFETLSYSKRGYLSLSWHPGLLSHNGQTYKLANCPGASVIGSDPVTEVCQHEVKKPCNLCPELELDWMVTNGEHSLHAVLGVRRAPKSYHSIGLRPFSGLKTLANALFVGQCSHDADAGLQSSNLPLKFSGPISPRDPKAGISIVAVDGDDGLRFISLCSLEGSHIVVLRNRACLACCLDVCQKVGSKVVIL